MFYKYSTGISIRGRIILVLHSSKNIKYTNTGAMLYGINVRYKCMQVLTYIQVLFNATTTTKYAILDLLLLNADTDVSTTHPRDEYLH